MAVFLAVSLLLGLILGLQNPVDLTAASKRLARLEAFVGSGEGSAETLQADLASAKRAARVCHEGLVSMVRMWNRYVDEIRAAESGSRARIRDAKRRFDRAKDRADQLVRRCDPA